MPGISVSNPIAGIVDAAAAPKGAEDANGGNFLALLNIAGQPEPQHQEYSNDDAPTPPDRGRRQETPVAAPMDAPVQQDNRPLQQAAEPVHEVTDAVVPHKAGNAKRAGHEQDAGEPAQEQTVQNDSQSAAPAATAKTQEPSAGGEVDETSQPGDELRDALGTQLGNIEQILATVIEALTGGSAGSTPSTEGVPAAVIPDAAPVISSSPADAALASLLPPAPAATDMGKDAAGIAVTAGNPSVEAISLLKDIHAILRQMQQILMGGAKVLHQGAQGGVDTGLPAPAGLALSSAQPFAAAVAAPSDNGQGDLQALTELLQQNVEKLTQLLAQQPADTDAAGPAPGWLKLVPFASASGGGNGNGIPMMLAEDDASLDIAALIKDSITEVRGKLKQLQNDNDGLMTQVRSDIQSQFAEAKLLFKDTAISDIAMQKDAALQPALPGNAGAVTPVQGQTPVTVNNATPVAGAVEAPMNMAQDGNSQSGNGDSGGGRQAMSSPLSAAGTGQPQAGSGAAGTQFARLLGQAAPEQAPKPVMEQVTFHIKTAASDGSSKIHIQLDPADLGKLEIKMHVGADGKTGVVITADNRSTLDLLQRDAQGLARALADAGLTTDSGSLSFNLRSGQQDAEQNDNQLAAGTYQKLQPEEEEDINLSLLTRSYVVNLAEGLDIKI